MLYKYIYIYISSQMTQQMITSKYLSRKPGGEERSSDHEVGRET